jgi:hypothetical protein
VSAPSALSPVWSVRSALGRVFSNGNGRVSPRASAPQAGRSSARALRGGGGGGSSSSRVRRAVSMASRGRPAGRTGRSVGRFCAAACSAARAVGLHAVSSRGGSSRSARRSCRSVSERRRVPVSSRSALVSGPSDSSPSGSSSSRSGSSSAPPSPPSSSRPGPTSRGSLTGLSRSSFGTPRSSAAVVSRAAPAPGLAWYCAPSAEPSSWRTGGGAAVSAGSRYSRVAGSMSENE